MRNFLIDRHMFLASESKELIIFNHHHPREKKISGMAAAAEGGVDTVDLSSCVIKPPRFGTRAERKGQIMSDMTSCISSM